MVGVVCESLGGAGPGLDSDWNDRAGFSLSHLAQALGEQGVLQWRGDRGKMGVTCWEATAEASSAGSSSL